MLKAKPRGRTREKLECPNCGNKFLTVKGLVKHDCTFKAGELRAETKRRLTFRHKGRVIQLSLEQTYLDQFKR